MVGTSNNVVETKPVTENKTKTKKNNKTNRGKNIFPIGYWKDINHNIEFWNDYISKDRDFCTTKYKMTKTQLVKRAYNVKQFLLSDSYTENDLKNVIKIKE